jgi:hypothetical protein
VVAYRADADEPTNIVPTGDRGRWQRVLTALHPATERIELQDAKKNTIIAMDFAAPDAGPRDDGTREEKLLALILRGQEMVLERQNSAMKGITDAYASLAKLLADRLTSLEKGYSEVLKGAFEATVMAAEAQAKLDGKSEDDTGVEALVKRVMQGLLPAAPDGVDGHTQVKQDAAQKGGAA